MGPGIGNLAIELLGIGPCFADRNGPAIVARGPVHADMVHAHRANEGTAPPGAVSVGTALLLRGVEEEGARTERRAKDNQNRAERAYLKADPLRPTPLVESFGVRHR